MNLSLIIAKGSKLYRKFYVILLTVFYASIYAQNCPSNIVFNCEPYLPNPCSKYRASSYIYNSTGHILTVTYNFGDGSPGINYSIPAAVTSTIMPTVVHSYITSGSYAITLHIVGSACDTTLSKSITTSCSSCSTYSVLSTGFDRVNHIPYPSNAGNFDPYWYVVKKQYIGPGPSYTPIAGSEIYYTNTNAYDIIPNGGSATSYQPGNSQYISISSTSSSQDPHINLVTYRTYFNLPNPLPANKTYSLALNIRCDDAVYAVTVNKTDLKATGYSPVGNSYTGSPLILSGDACSLFVPNANYIDITVGDLALAATQLSAEILLYECSGHCGYSPPPCTDCISSFAPIPGKKYLVSAWAKESGAAQSVTAYTKPQLTVLFPSVSGSVGPFIPSGAIIDGWQRIEGEFTIPASATDISLKLDCTSGDCFYDDVRVLPFDGSMKSYVYDPVNMRLVAELDERNYATLYEYDEEGKLVRVKKETEKGIMTIQENRNNTKK